MDRLTLEQVTKLAQELRENSPMQGLFILCLDQLAETMQFFEVAAADSQFAKAECVRLQNENKTQKEKISYLEWGVSHNDELIGRLQNENKRLREGLLIISGAKHGSSSIIADQFLNPNKEPNNG